MLILLLMSIVMIQTTQARTCYPSTNTTKPFLVLDKTLVETPRGCEVFCDANSKCVGFSYQDSGLNSSCALLSPNNANEICTKPTTIFLKQTTDCPDRTNLAAELGNDPCIDSFVSAGVGKDGLACSEELRAKNYILRVVTADGIRKSMDSSGNTFITKYEEMWELKSSFLMNFAPYSVKIVAAVCASAGSVKCPCAPLEQLTRNGTETVAVTPDRADPCNGRGGVTTRAEHVGSETTVVMPSKSWTITCKAGQWYQGGYFMRANAMYVINGAAC